jgi:hypothetical protein
MNYLAAAVCFVCALALGLVFSALPDGEILPLWDLPLLAGMGLSAAAGMWFARRAA